MKKVTNVCFACGKVGHRQQTVPFIGSPEYQKSGSTGAYKCPLLPGWGKTGKRLDSGRCSECGYSNFTYSNGHEISEDGVRGYRCVGCGAIKPESRGKCDEHGKLTK